MGFLNHLSPNVTATEANNEGGKNVSKKAWMIALRLCGIWFIRNSLIALFGGITPEGACKRAIADGRPDHDILCVPAMVAIGQ